MTNKSPALNEIRIGIDTGGTFTDFVIYTPFSGALETFKLPSTPKNPAGAVIAGLERIRTNHPEAILRIVHGSTVATNALLERKGARTALVTTRGFRDVLAIGRQNRPDLYALAPTLPEPLVPEDLRFEVVERVNAAGDVLVSLDPRADEVLIDVLAEAGEVESVAICLLFSFLHPDHEKKLAESLRRAGYFVSASYEILPEFREYERTSTTVINAYVAPILDRYLGEIEKALPVSDGTQSASSLAIMQSNGGTISPGQARREAVRCILSGPAGGVIAAKHLGEGESTHAYGSLLTIDMGGTSTDVSLITGEPIVTTEAVIAGLPIGIPVLDIHTIGAGGGSIAAIDPGGGLKVGPRSAGADPGPASYGRTSGPGLPTVTDANLVLGRLLPDHFLGGEMPLYPDRAREAIAHLADQLHLDVEEAASGIVQIINAHMARALRVISVEKGHDPAGFALVSFGGAGGLHAVELARELGIPRVIIPRHASTFSALGMLLADVVKDYSRTVMAPGSTGYSELEALLSPLVDRASMDLIAEGIAGPDIQLFPSIDVRFSGQSYELNVPLTPVWRKEFERLYTEMYGYLPDLDAVEIVNIRLQARGDVPAPVLSMHKGNDPDPSTAALGSNPVWIQDHFETVPVYNADLLSPGNLVTGPALISRSDTTIWLPPGAVGKVDGGGNIIVSV